MPVEKDGQLLLDVPGVHDRPSQSKAIAAIPRLACVLTEPRDISKAYRADAST
jgi:hypothetical protein